MDCNNSSDYIINILKEIESKQNYNDNPCKQALGMDKYIYNTIPLIFICKNECRYFVGSGVFKDSITNNFKCFETPVFRLVKFDEEKNTCVLELLQPQTLNGEISSFSCKSGVCKFFSSVSISKFIKTGICIKVNLNCFCGIECLQPICAKHGIIKGDKDNPHTINVETSEYITVSDGIKKIYLNSDGIQGFNIIPNPLTLSYANLFVNGILQPTSFYTVEEGKLTLNTEDIPMLGTYIILQLIKINK